MSRTQNSLVETSHIGGAPCTQTDSSTCPPKPYVSHDSLRRMVGGDTEASIVKMRKGRSRVWTEGLAQVHTAGPRSETPWELVPQAHPSDPVQTLG